jgi:hypothetical protein
MNTINRCLLVSCCTIAAMTASARGVIALAEWTFESSGPGLVLNNSATSPNAIAEGGVFAGALSIASGLHASAATDWSSPVGNASLEAFSANTWATGDYWQFTTNTTGFSGISISWHQTRSGTGPATFDLLWSTDGTTFTPLLNDYSVPEVTWSSVGLPQVMSIFGPQAGPAALDNQATIYFRLLCDAEPGSAGGTNRIDNVVISAAIPGPGTLALMSMAGLCTFRRRRNAGTASNM